MKNFVATIYEKITKKKQKQTNKKQKITRQNCPQKYRSNFLMGVVVKIF